MRWVLSPWILGLLGTFQSVSIASPAMDSPVSTSTTLQSNAMCTIWVSGLWCEVLVNGSALEQSELTIPCNALVTLFVPPTPDCNFKNWRIPPDRLPVEYLVFENPWTFRPIDLPNNREPNIYAVLDVEPIRFVRPLEDTALYVGQDYRLRVEVEGGTSVKYYAWKKDGAPFANSLAYWPIQAATDSHAGSYTCSVSATGTYTVESSAVIEVYSRASTGFHHADTNQDWLISIHELLRVIQFYNVGGYHCAAGTEDGFSPGLGDDSCTAHHGDYGDQDWAFSLNEVLRIIQFYNAPGGAYHAESGTEDGFAPQAG